jgi:hypothetical protein
MAFSFAFTGPVHLQQAFVFIKDAPIAARNQEKIYLTSAFAGSPLRGLLFRRAAGGSFPGHWIKLRRIGRQQDIPCRGKATPPLETHLKT